MDRLRTALLEHRRALAAVCTAAAVLLALVAARQPGDLTSVPVAARDLASGQVLTAADVDEVRLPAGSVPRGVVAHDEPVGRRVGGPMRAGEPFTDARLLATSSADGLRDGHVLSTVTVADPGAAQGLRPGDRVDVLAVTPRDGGPRADVVASGLVVAAVPPADGSGARDVATLTVRSPRDDALRLARAGLEAELTVVVAAPSGP